MAIQHPFDPRTRKALVQEPLRSALLEYFADLRHSELESLSKVPAGADFRFHQGRASFLSDLIALLQKPTP